MLDSFKSTLQIAHPLHLESMLEDAQEYGIKLFGLELPRLEPFSIPRGHPAATYLDCRLHDAGIFSFTTDGSNAKLTVNDYDGWRFAGAYEQRIGKWSGIHSRISPPVPISLEFRDLVEFKVYQSEPSGKLTQVKHSLRSNLAKFNEFYTDRVLYCDNHSFVAIFEIRVNPARYTLISEDLKWPVGRILYSHEIILCMHAKQVVVRENQRESWINHFGSETVWLWDRYSKERSELKLHGWADFVNYLEKLHAE